MTERDDAFQPERRTRPVAMLIGSGRMPVQAAEMLTREGFELVGLHSPDEPLRDWAEHRQSHFLADFESFRERGETVEYDYLFSVRNLRILPASLLSAPRVFAVNYHDAPLPRYAGSHATAWALHNREPTHGITWHVMVERVDTGDILKQILFPIPPAMTKTQLDQRCYVTALLAFRDLLNELKAGRATRTPQDLGQRTFYRSDSYPADGV